MKYHEISPAPKLAVRRTTAAAMFEHGGMLERIEAAGWIRPLPPVDPKQQFDLFSVMDLEIALVRLQREGWPQ